MTGYTIIYMMLTFNIYMCIYKFFIVLIFVCFKYFFGLVTDHNIHITSHNTNIHITYHTNVPTLMTSKGVETMAAVNPATKLHPICSANVSFA